MIHLSSDYSDIDAELDRLGGMPTKRVREKLDAVLHTGFVATQAAVHVETGALKASGKESSEVDRLAATWEGEISYGDDDGGAVDYAIYEKDRGVGGAGGASNAKGDHDFMRPLKALDPEFKLAMLEALKP